jgi:hypothetical protein
MSGGLEFNNRSRGKTAMTVRFPYREWRDHCSFLLHPSNLEFHEKASSAVFDVNGNQITANWTEYLEITIPECEHSSSLSTFRKQLNSHVGQVVSSSDQFLEGR